MVCYRMLFVCTKEVKLQTEEGSYDIIHNKLRNLFVLNFVKRKSRSFYYLPRRYFDNIYFICAGNFLCVSVCMCRANGCCYLCATLIEYIQALNKWLEKKEHRNKAKWI